MLTKLSKKGVKTVPGVAKVAHKWPPGSPKAPKVDPEIDENLMKTRASVWTGKLSSELHFTFSKQEQQKRTEWKEKEKQSKQQAARVHGENHCSDFRRELELMHTKAKQVREGKA